MICPIGSSYGEGGGGVKRDWMDGGTGETEKGRKEGKE